MTALKLLVISTLLEEVVYFLAVGFHEVYVDIFETESRHRGTGWGSSDIQILEMIQVMMLEQNTTIEKGGGVKREQTNVNNSRIDEVCISIEPVTGADPGFQVRGRT